MFNAAQLIVLRFETLNSNINKSTLILTSKHLYNKILMSVQTYVFSVGNCIFRCRHCFFLEMEAERRW